MIDERGHHTEIEPGDIVEQLEDYNTWAKPGDVGIVVEVGTGYDDVLVKYQPLLKPYGYLVECFAFRLKKIEAPCQNL